MQKILHMIGNTHFDPVWLWTWDEAMASIRATFHSALERMEEYPDFKYSFSTPAVFEWIENTEPEMFAEIKKRVEEGRWELAEGWWLQPDCICASGESYVRQGLYAQKYYLKHFGKLSKTVFNVDSFGHPASLPQILNQCGIQNYMFCRPCYAHKQLEEPLFVWKGANHSKVYTYRIGNQKGDGFKPEVNDIIRTMIEDYGEKEYPLCAIYGVTDHGGAPTKEAIEHIYDFNRSSGTYAAKLSTVEAFFAQVSQCPLAEVEDELLVNFIGPYTNEIEIKKNNRMAEYTLLNAEKAAVIAHKVLGKAYPAEVIEQCWKDLMFNQFHDILGGACIKEAYYDARNMHGRVLQTAGERLHFSLQSICADMNMPGKNGENAWNLVVWNLNGFDVCTPVEAEVQWAWEFDWYDKGIELVDEDGNCYECQVIEERSVIPGFRTRFVFRAQIPALGYKAFKVMQTHKESPRIAQRLEIPGNDRFECIMSISPNQELSTKQWGEGITGTPEIRLFDKDKNCVVMPSLPVPYVVADECDTWGFNKTVYEEEREKPKLVSYRIIEQGSIRTTVKLIWHYHMSVIEQYYTLYDDFVECRYRVCWNEQKKALKFSIVSDLEKPKCLAAIPYGRIERGAEAFERPMGEWLTLSEGNDNVNIMVDSIFAYHFDGREVGLTVLRSCIYGDLRTQELDPEGNFRYMGQGVTEGRIRISFGDTPEKEAICLNNPPIVTVESNHGGTLKGKGQFFQTHNDNVILSALKLSEDGKATVARLFETKGESCIAEGRVFDEIYREACSGDEIMTLRMVAGTVEKVTALEEKVTTLEERVSALKEVLSVGE